MRKAASAAIACVVLTMTANGQSAPGSKGITAVPGIRVGHFTLPGGMTGCSVVLADGDGAVGGVSQRGGAPGTRETDLLDPLNLVERVNAIVLSGGSAFGLDAAQGVEPGQPPEGFADHSSTGPADGSVSRAGLLLRALPTLYHLRPASLRAAWLHSWDVIAEQLRQVYVIDHAPARLLNWLRNMTSMSRTGPGSPDAADGPLRLSSRFR